MTAPAISVIIPVRNSARFIASAVESVLGQQWSMLEILVVDGQSTDGSAEIAASYPAVRIVDQSGSGLSDAWNCGLDEAGGEYIAFLDSDDLWLAGKLARQAAMLDTDPGLDLVDGMVEFFVEPGASLPPSMRPEILDGVFVGRMPSSWLARRALFDRIGRFDTALELTGDMDWYRRVQDSDARLAAVPELVVRKRIHEQNLSTGTRSSVVYNRELAHFLKRSLDRRRR